MQNKRGEKSKTMQNKSKIITTSIFRRGGVLNKSLSVNEKEKKTCQPGIGTNLLLFRTNTTSDIAIPDTIWWGGPSMDTISLAFETIHPSLTVLASRNHI